MADPLVTAEELAGYLQSDIDRYSADLAVQGASGLVRGYCRWNISQEQTDWTLDGNGATVLNLPTLHLVQVNEVQIDGVTIDPAEDGIVGYGGYRWSVGGQLSRAGGWPLRFGCVWLDVVHGYDPVPDAVRLVTLALAGRSFVNPDRVVSRTVGGVSTTWDASGTHGLHELEMAHLDAYRLP